MSKLSSNNEGCKSDCGVSSIGGFAAYEACERKSNLPVLAKDAVSFRPRSGQESIEPTSPSIDLFKRGGRELRSEVVSTGRAR